jgi:hypothetical protein
LNAAFFPESRVELAIWQCGNVAGTISRSTLFQDALVLMLIPFYFSSKQQVCLALTPGVGCDQIGSNVIHDGHLNMVHEYGIILLATEA